MKGIFNITIPNESQNGKILRLKKLGMPVFGKKGEFGDLYVRIIVEIPQKLSEEEQALFTKLATLRKVS